MKTLLTISTLVLTLMFSSPSYAEWTKVSTTVEGDTFYVDFERIRKHDGYVYWWGVSNLLKPDKDGDLSYKLYHQGDCELFRFKFLSASTHKISMGEGKSYALADEPQGKWEYPRPNSVSEDILKSVCSR